MPRTRRCPLHPEGCVKHPNPNPPRPKRVLVPAEARGQELRGSFNRLVTVLVKPGRGNPRKRRLQVSREQFVQDRVAGS